MNRRVPVCHALPSQTENLPGCTPGSLFGDKPFEWSLGRMGQIHMGKSEPLRDARGRPDRQRASSCSERPLTRGATAKPAVKKAIDGSEVAPSPQTLDACSSPGSRGALFNLNLRVGLAPLG